MIPFKLSVAKQQIAKDLSHPLVDCRLDGKASFRKTPEKPEQEKGMG